MIKHSVFIEEFDYGLQKVVILNSQTSLVLEVEKAGADIIEIGLPFGDSLADGPVIQASYSKSLNSTNK